MTKSEIAKKIYELSHITGEFLLRSGQISNEYFDKYLFEANPVVLKEIATQMVDLIPDGSDVIAGLEMGGIPVCTAISAQNLMPCAFVRKEAKKYGTCKLAEGADIDGKKVCIIEDVVTTGGAIIDGVRELRARGAIIDTVVCVILRDERAYDILAEHNLKLIPAFTMEYIKEQVK